MLPPDEEIVTVLQNFADQGLKLLRDKGNIAPTIFANTRDEGIIALSLDFFGTPEEKVFYDVYGKIMQIYDVDFYVVMLEAWYGVANVEDVESDEELVWESKQECATFVFVSKKQTVTCTYPFYRDVEGKVNFICEAEIGEMSKKERRAERCYSLLDFTGRLSDTDKEQLKVLLPVKERDELLAIKDVLLN